MGFMGCSRTVLVHRYHDGELSPAEREAAESHIRDCGECGRELADLRRLSAMISQASLVEMPVGAVGRLGECRGAVTDRGVLRITGWLTAAAAAVLMGALLTWPAEDSDLIARPAIWETAAVTPVVDAGDDTNSDLVTLAQWMADELSSSRTR
jgi:anti-sigma factor RsiW